ncbi:alpha/beta fold hydrolase [Dactylosporangium sp. CA-233914]|uniref:alpha/beta fold hydrolase n=1 Tax=Dactylosporangium sp. CA-233914 TaxID=3239934 RepID=UPI003D8C3B4D
MTVTFLLLHGGGHGGWCWRDVVDLLRRAGHRVYAPTLTGYGDREHLRACVRDFATFVLDVVNVVEHEELRDVHIVAHSQGGVLAPRVAEAIPDRIAQVTWLAGVVLADGERLADVVPPATSLPGTTDHPDGSRTVDVDAWVAAVMPEGTAQQRRWVATHFRPSPHLARVEPGRLSAFLALGLPTAFIAATEDVCVPIDLARRFTGRLPGAKTVDVAAGHELMVTRPAETAAAILAAQA